MKGIFKIWTSTVFAIIQLYKMKHAVYASR